MHEYCDQYLLYSISCIGLLFSYNVLVCRRSGAILQPIIFIGVAMLSQQIKELNSKETVFWLFGFTLLMPLIFFWPRALPGLLIYFTLLSFVSIGPQWRDLFRIKDVFIVLFLFLSYAIFSLLWAENPLFGMKEILKILLYSLCGMITLNCLVKHKVDSIKKYFNLMAYASIASSLIWIFLYIADFKIFSFDLASSFHYDLGSFRRGSHLCAVLLFPLSIYLWQFKKRLLAEIAFVALFCTIYLSSKHTAFLVVLMTAALLPFVFMLRGWFIRLFQLCLIVFFFFAPIVVEPFVEPALTYAEKAQETDVKIPTSFLHRLKIWDFTSHKIIEKPIQGYGFGSSRFLGAGQRTSLTVSLLPYFKGVESPDKETLWVLGDLSLLPLHPHNAFLQIWLELGLVGMLIAAAFLFFLIEKGLSMPKRAQQMIFMGALFPALVVVNMSYGLWQSWWICSLFIIAGIVQMMSRVLDERG